MITIHLKTNTSTPLYEQIYGHLKNEIQIGSLLPGSKLPSTRNFGTYLQVSRNTVEMAYEQLMSEGYIESIPKKGYFINQISQLSAFSSLKNHSTVLSSKIDIDYDFDFSPFAIDIHHFPYSIWRRLSNTCLNSDNRVFLLGDGQGDDTFRKEIVRYLHSSRGVNCSATQIIIGAGADYLLQLLVQLLPSQSIIAMENPTYKQAYKIFTGLQYKTLPISLDKNGINIHDLSICPANIAYVTPSHQYPLGIVMPVKRRFELLNWASLDSRNYIIEDDHDSEFRYKGKPIPALQGLDTLDKVIYMGTFSRAIAPAIRIGYMVLPHSLLKIYTEQFNYYSSTVSRIDQSIVTAFLEQGYFERHLNRMRKLYKNKQEQLIQSLKIFGSKICIQGENAGLHLVIQIHVSLSEKEVVLFAKKAKIKLYGLTEHYIEAPVSPLYPAFLLGYANMREDEIEKGTKQLYTILAPFFIL